MVLSNELYLKSKGNIMLGSKTVLIENDLLQKYKKSFSWFNICSINAKILCSGIKRIFFHKENNLTAPIFNWINAQYALGLLSSKNSDINKVLIRYYKRLINFIFSKKVLFNSPNQYLHMIVVFRLFQINQDKCFKKFLDRAVKQLFSEYSPNDLLNYWKGEEIFYIDLLGMILPFLFEYGTYNKDQRLVQLAETQLDYTIKMCKKEESLLPFHMYDTNTNEHFGSKYWGRGCGWYLLGLLTGSIYNPKKYKKEFLSLLRYIQRQINFDGFLYDDLKEKNHIDTSITSMFAVSYIVALDNNWINDSEYTEIIKVVEALCRSVNEKGEVENCSGECLGANKYSKNFGNYFAQGYTLITLNLIKNSEKLKSLFI